MINLKGGDFLYCKKDYIRVNNRGYFMKGVFYKIVGILMREGGRIHKVYLSDHLNTEWGIKISILPKYFCTKKELLNKKLKKVLKTNTL